MIKELNLKFKTKENPDGIKRETHWVKTTVKMILLAVMIFWVSVMNKLYYDR
jgi:hypothetical protein